MFRPRESWGLDTILKDNGRKKMLWLPRGIVIPCFTADGRVHRIRIRRPAADLKTGEDVKYYVVPGSGMDAMVFYPDRQAFVVVESELDAMVLARKAGAVAGIVALGSSHNKPGSRIYYQLAAALRVLVALDFDRAGLSAWDWWKDQFANARQWPVPDGKDPGEAWQRGVDLLRWVLEGLPPALTLHFGGLDAAAAKDAAAVEVTDSGPEGSDGRPGDVPVGTGLPASILQFRELLRRYPIKVRATAARSSLIFSNGWYNHEISQQASRLMFFDPDVFDYLHLHPDDIIHRGNFDRGTILLDRAC